MLQFLRKLFGGNTVDISGMLAEGAIILDVRTPGEYRRGHVKGSKNIPLQELQRQATKIKKWQKPVITCCASGSRSGMAAKMLNGWGVEAANGGPWIQVKNAIDHA